MALIGSITPTKPPIKDGLVFNVSSFDPDSYPGASGIRYWECTESGIIGVHTTTTNDSPTGNQDPTTITDTDIGTVFSFSGGMNPSSGWWRFPSTVFPTGSAARTYNVWLNYDVVSGNHAFGGQDGTPTWASHSTGTAYLFANRGTGYEIVGHGFDQESGYSEATGHIDKWINLVVTNDANQLKFYRNGIEIGTPIDSTSFNTPQTNFFIGRGWSKSDIAGEVCRIAHWSVYDRMLEDSEVVLLHGWMMQWIKDNDHSY